MWPVRNTYRSDPSFVQFCRDDKGEILRGFCLLSILGLAKTSEQHYSYWQREAHVRSCEPEKLKCLGEANARTGHSSVTAVHQDAVTACIYLIFVLDFQLCLCVKDFFILWTYIVCEWTSPPWLQGGGSVQEDPTPAGMEEGKQTLANAWAKLWFSPKNEHDQGSAVHTKSPWTGQRFCSSDNQTGKSEFTVGATGGGCLP